MTSQIFMNTSDYLFCVIIKNEPDIPFLSLEKTHRPVFSRRKGFLLLFTWACVNYEVSRT